MSSFTQFINFIMALIDLIKRYFGGNHNDTPDENDDPQQDPSPAAAVQP